MTPVAVRSVLLAKTVILKPKDQCGTSKLHFTKNKTVNIKLSFVKCRTKLTGKLAAEFEARTA